MTREKIKLQLQLFAAPIKNPDEEANITVELQEKIKNAIESGDADAFAAVQIEIANSIQEKILAEAKLAKNEDANDTAVMVQRGLNPLTTEEKAYYNEVISAGGFAGVEKLIPATVFERVFEDLKAEHALLSEITFTNTTGVTEWVSRNNDVEAAWWGSLTDEIKKKLEMAFKKEKTELYKLSAFVPVCKSMLDLGPQWLDRFVREILFESLAIALELAIVAGDGKNQPIGMMKNLKGAVIEGSYPDKTAIQLVDLKPATLGSKIMAPLTKDGKRTVPKVLLVVNPVDYWEKIFPGTTVMSASGTYVYGVLPIPATIVQSVAVPKGKMIAGMAKCYFIGVGSQQKFEYSDQYRFLEDERVYLAKQYANGRPQEDEDFILFDISKLKTE